MESAASEARRAREPASPLNCPWCRGIKKADRPGDNTAVYVVYEKHVHSRASSPSKWEWRPAGEKFIYPNFAVFVGNSQSGRRITAFFDPKTGAAAIIQGTPSTRDLTRDEKSSGIYFPKGKRTITVTVDFPAKTIHYLVGDWQMSAPFLLGFKLDTINIIGLESYRTGATFSNFRFGSLADKENP